MVRKLNLFEYYVILPGAMVFVLFFFLQIFHQLSLVTGTFFFWVCRTHTSLFFFILPYSSLQSVSYVFLSHSSACFFFHINKSRSWQTVKRKHRYFVSIMLYLVGLGLGDEKDITVKGLEIVRKCQRVYLEHYTSILTVGKEALEKWVYCVRYVRCF